MEIYQISFDYSYALADVVESLNGADSLELCAERPELMDKFRYGWLTNESTKIPDFVIIMSTMLGCKVEIFKDIKNLFSNLVITPIPIKVGTDDYVLFSNIPILSDHLNLKKSKITRFSNGDIMEIPTPVFLLGNYPSLFKVKEMPSTYFCTQESKSLIDGRSYTGLLFEVRKIKSKSWF